MILGIVNMDFFKKIIRYITCRIKILYLNFADSALYKYVVCKNCKNCIRLPKNKGKLIVSCPKCGEISEVDT